MRWSIVVALMGCSSRATPTPPPQAAIDRCTRGAAALLDALRDLAPTSKFAALGDRPLVRDVACADLYRQPACAQAWRDAFDPAALDPSADAAARVVSACTAAYCSQLPIAPMLCTQPLATLDGPTRLFRLRELDAAILVSEGLDGAVAHTIASRVALFERAVRTRDANRSAPAPTPDALVVVIDDAGQLAVARKPIDRAALTPLFETLAAASGQLVIQVHRATPHGAVVELMEQAKRAGVTRLAIGTAD